jgi:hypothetical protein
VRECVLVRSAKFGEKKSPEMTPSRQLWAKDTVQAAAVFVVEMLGWLARLKTRKNGVWDGMNKRYNISNY